MQGLWVQQPSTAIVRVGCELVREGAESDALQPITIAGFDWRHEGCLGMEVDTAAAAVLNCSMETCCSCSSL